MCQSALAHTVLSVLSQRSDLSILTAAVNSYPTLFNQLQQAGGTLLAPTDDAIKKFLAMSGFADVGAVPQAALNDLISYHILNKTLPSADLAQKGGILANTTLADQQYANLAGAPNVVFSSAFGSTGQAQAAASLQIYSGIGDPANVLARDLVFNDGTGRDIF